MAKSDQESSDDISIKRMRFGMLLLLLWVIPFWLLTPLFASPDNVAKATLLVSATQTCIGLVGAFVVGKPVYQVIKHTPRKLVFKKIWGILISGKMD